MSFHLAFKILVQNAGSVGNISKKCKGKDQAEFQT